LVDVEKNKNISEADNFLYKISDYIQVDENGVEYINKKN